MPASEREAVARGHSSDKSSEYEDIRDDYVYVCNQSIALSPLTLKTDKELLKRRWLLLFNWFTGFFNVDEASWSFGQHLLYPEGLSNLAQIGKTSYLHSTISPYYYKVPLELLFPTTNRRSYFLKSYVFCSANSVPLYLLLLTSALHFNSYYFTSSLFPNKSYLLVKGACPRLFVVLPYSRATFNP